MLTIIESSYSGDVAENLVYVRACMRAVLLDGGTPFASHALYTQDGVLDDAKPEERTMGMVAGWQMYRHAYRALFMLDRGTSEGMAMGLVVARRFCVPYSMLCLREGSLTASSEAWWQGRDKLLSMANDPVRIAEVGRLLCERRSYRV